MKETIKKTALMQSFARLDKKFIHVVFLDFIYYLILLFAGSFYIYKILPSFLHVLDVAEVLQTGGYESLEQLLTAFDSLSAEVTTFKIWTAAIALLLIANYALFKYLIWNKILKNKEKPKIVAKHTLFFALLNILIAAKAIVVLVISYYIFTIDFFNLMFFLIVPLAVIFKINIVHPLFAMHKNIKETYKAFVTIATKKCYVFIVPYVVMAAGLVLLIQFILPLFLFLPNAAYFVVYVLTFAAYFSWTKYYIYEIIQRAIKQNKKSKKQK